MLPRQYRLKNKSAFNATYRIQNSFYKNGIVLFAGNKTDSNTSVKIGFVVSKKTHKRAVKRNRLKRLMRESVRLLLKENIELNKAAEIHYINKMIVKAAEDGRWNFEVSGLYKETIELLKNAGYHVQRTSYNYVVSWQ